MKQLDYAKAWLNSPDMPKPWQEEGHPFNGVVRQRIEQRDRFKKHLPDEWIKDMEDDPVDQARETGYMGASAPEGCEIPEGGELPEGVTWQEIVDVTNTQIEIYIEGDAPLPSADEVTIPIIPIGEA